MNVLEKFLIVCSGSSFQLLKKTPTEISKHVGIGGVIFFTGLLASISACYALFSVFDNLYLSIGFGVIWGLMIFNLDRYIVSSMKKQSNLFNQLLIALPRIIVAILLGIVISKPLELKIFEKEINKQLNTIVNRNKANLQTELTNRYTQLEQPYLLEKQEINANINTLRKEYNNLATDLEKEIVGTQTETTTGKQGFGENAKRKSQLKNEKWKELENYITKSKLRLDFINNEIDKITKEKELELTGYSKTEEKYNGFAARIQALQELSDDNKILGTTILFITLVFIALETAPVLVKLISPRGPYDFLLEKHEHTYKIFAKETIKILDIESDKKIKIKENKS